MAINDSKSGKALQCDSTRGMKKKGLVSSTEVDEIYINGWLCSKFHRHNDSAMLFSTHIDAHKAWVLSLLFGDVELKLCFTALLYIIYHLLL